MACAKLFRSTGIPKNNIKMLDTKGVINKKEKILILGKRVCSRNKR